MFKKILFITTFTFIATQSFAYDAQVCKKQKQNVEKQIQESKRYNNVQRIKSLEKSLERIQKVCDKQIKK